MLWMAPEVLRSEKSISTKEGDIYSFAIICSEIVTKRPAWNYIRRNESIDGTI